MQTEIELPISSQRACSFFAYKTHFGCLDTKIRSGVDIKCNVAISIFMKFIKCSFKRNNGYTYDIFIVICLIHFITIIVLLNIDL
jgi:hypothetical protein